MNVNIQKAKSMVNRYRSGSLPQTQPSRASGTQRATYFQDVFEQLPLDDNGPLDGNRNQGVVDYVGGDQIGYAYEYSEDSMVGTSDHNGIGQYEEFKFSADAIEHVSGRYESGGGQGTLSVTTYDLTAQTTQDSRWQFADDTLTLQAPEAMTATAAESPVGYEPVKLIKQCPEGVDPKVFADRKSQLKSSFSSLFASPRRG